MSKIKGFMLFLVNMDNILIQILYVIHALIPVKTVILILVLVVIIIQ